MKIEKLIILFTIILSISTLNKLSAQNYDNDCKTILKLYESGKKDSAYVLIEPLKKKAPYSVSVLYTRAQMTPDARAISLYERIIALEPNGTFTERALYQLVRRHTENKDSLSAFTWLGLLKERFPSSANLKAAESAINSIVSWKGDLALPIKNAKPDVNLGTTSQTPNTDKAITTADKKETKPNTDTKEVKSKKDFITGIALQLGVFPSKDLAEKAMDKVMEQFHDLRLEVLPKLEKGKKMYALITGPYKTIDLAKKSALALTGACNCKPFPVNVE